MRLIACWRLICSATALLIGLTGCVHFGKHPAVPGDFFFIQMTDPQFGMFEKNVSFARETALFEEAIAQANTLKPLFVVVTGDMVNRPGDAGQIAELLRVAGQLDSTIPLYWAPGNHDVKNCPDDTSLAAYREQFGADWYTFERGGWRFIVINSTLLKASDCVMDDYNRQQEWLEHMLATDVMTHQGTIVLQHHPLFLKAPDEADQYYNIEIERRMDYLRLFAQLGTKAIFAGHYHQSSYGTYMDIEMVTSAPVGMPHGEATSGITIISVSRGVVSHRFVPLLTPTPND